MKLSRAVACAIILTIPGLLASCDDDDPFAPSPADVSAVVTDESGNGLGGVTIQQVGGAASATTSAQGRATLTLPVGETITLSLAAAGKADQFKVLTLPAGTDTAYFEAQLIDREAAETLANAENGGTVTGKNGTLITLPAGALVTAGGSAVTGNVQVALTPVDIESSEIGAFPGLFTGTEAGGGSALLASFGTAEILLTQGGQALQLAAGSTATIEIPLYATQNPDGSPVTLGQLIAIWSLDETTGIWDEEVDGIVVASTSDSGFAVRADITHLSWWNIDLAFAVSGFVRPRCLGVSGSFSLVSACNIVGGTISGGTPQSVASGDVPASGSSEALPIMPDQNIRVRGCATVETTDGEQGVACGSTVVNVAPQLTEDADVQLQIENDWAGTVAGSFVGPITSTLRIIGTSISGTTTGFGASWDVDGTVNADDTVSFGLASGPNTVEFNGSLNALRTVITGDWEITAGVNQGATGTFTLGIDS